ncbi:MAG: hypothetical protein BAJATHORv1_10457 [Candidatus Thorarchaeota archaeon]|nr:MAG: hypothetical protein BAJATHORv1_10457 [Candidatus Thorarchaeota archaeon]
MTRFLIDKGHDGPIRKGELEVGDSRFVCPLLIGPNTKLPFEVVGRDLASKAVSLKILPSLTNDISLPDGPEPLILPSLPNSSLFGRDAHRTLLDHQLDLLDSKDESFQERAVVRTSFGLTNDTYLEFLSRAKTFGIRSVAFQFDGYLGQNDLNAVDLRISTPLSWLTLALGRVDLSLLPLLVYLGFDLIDISRAEEAASKDLRLWKLSTEEFGEHYDERYCSCPACNGVSLSDLSESERYKVLFKHNSEQYRILLSECIELSNRGLLRWLVESMTHATPNLAGFTRRISSTFYDYLEEFTPTIGSGVIPLIGPESYWSPTVKRFRDYVRIRYTPPSQKKAILLLPCSARKPYSDSRSHKRFRNAIDSALGSAKHEIAETILTSPIALVPRELERAYPAANYDIPVTGKWDAEELEIAANALVDHLSKFDVSVPVLVHASGGYRAIVEQVEDQIDQDIIYTNIVGSPTRRSSLQSLSEKLTELKEGIPLEKGHSTELEDTLRATADFQFGTGAGSLLIPEESKIKGKLYRMVVSKIGKEQTCAFVSENGVLSLTLFGGELLKPLGRYWARFEGEKVRGGALFAVGVKSADPNIRPGDEVIVLNRDDNVVAVGRSEMSGREMCELDYGHAITFRHKVK